MRILSGIYHEGDYLLQHPFKLLLAGSSGSGKTR